MLHWINTHGVESVIFGYLFACAVGSMPPIPTDAGYWSKWAYGFLHAAAGNLRQAADLFGVKLPASNGK